MIKRVVLITSGETERRSLPHLLAHLRAEDISVEIRRPDGNKALSVEMAERLVKAAWWAPTENVAPDKFVILVDADGKDPLPEGRIDTLGRAARKKGHNG